MRIALRLLAALVCISASARGETVALQGVAQGTTYHIKYVSTNKSVDRDELQADVEKELAEIDREMSTYGDDSEISRFNRARSGEWSDVSRAVAEVVAASREISEKT